MNRRNAAALLTLAAVGLGAVGCATQDPLGAIATSPSATPSPSGSLTPSPTHPPTPTVEPFLLGPSDALGPLATPGPVGSPGPEEMPIPFGAVLAPPAVLRPGPVGDGIQCEKSEKLLFHVHTRLAIFINGEPRQVPYGIGIAPPWTLDHKPDGNVFVTNGSCFSWLHTHTPDGMIHIEAPIPRTFTLGDFFDVWGQRLSPNQIGPYTGQVTAFFNGQRYLGNPRDIPIGYHVQIQLDLGSPVVAPADVEFRGGL
ncbi:MAG TPA: hypothetical protein VGL04_07615 [Sporichthyaceae bacterium]